MMMLIIVNHHFEPPYSCPSTACMSSCREEASSCDGAAAVEDRPAAGTHQARGQEGGTQAVNMNIHKRYIPTAKC